MRLLSFLASCVNTAGSYAEPQKVNGPKSMLGVRREKVETPYRLVFAIPRAPCTPEDEILTDLDRHYLGNPTSSQNFGWLFETSKLLFTVLDVSNSWSLEEALLGSHLDDEEIILCRRSLQIPLWR